MKNSGNGEFAVISIVFFLILFLSTGFGASADDFFKITSPSYFSEQDIVYNDIHYLENEFLSFRFCPAGNISQIEVESVCDIGSDTKLTLHEDHNEKGCYFSNYDLEKIKCNEFSLVINYRADSIDKQIKRTFQKQKQSKLINHILGISYNLLDSGELSYYLIVLNDITTPRSEESELAYEKLKTDRNNNDKCWPKSSCSISTTAKILRNIKLASYETDSRLLDDGKTYIEKKLVSNTNNPLSFTITLEEDDFKSGKEIQCGLTIDDDSVKNYIFEEDENEITKKASEYIKFECNETIDEISFVLKNSNNNTKFSEEYTLDTGFEYSIEEFSCVGTSKACDYDSTIDTLNIYGDEIADYDLLHGYIESLIVEEPDGETYIDTKDKFEDIGKYLYYEEDEPLTEYLKFHQNNDGSWGTSNSKYDKVVQTSWAVLGLQNIEPNSEYVLDGKKWIYYNEPESGWGDVEKNTMAYLAIKEQIKPYLSINTVNSISDWAHFNVKNPTIHNLKDVTVSVSENLAPFVSYKSSLGDLKGEMQSSFNITLKDNFYGKLTGDLTITGVDGKNNEIELVKFPLNLQGPTPITIIGGEYIISEDEPTVKLEIEKNIPKFSFSCTYVNPFTKESETKQITNADTTFEVSNTALKSGSFEIELTCDYEGNEIKQDIAIDVTVATKTFEINVEKYNMTSFDNFSLTFTSTTKEIQTITFDFEGDYKGIIEAAESSKIIAANDVRELYFSIRNPSFLEILGNMSAGNIVIISDSGYVKKIPILYNVNETAQSGGIPKWLKWVLSILILISIFFGVNIYRYKQYLKQEQENQGQYQEEVFLDEEI